MAGEKLRRRKKRKKIPPPPIAIKGEPGERNKTAELPSFRITRRKKRGEKEKGRCFLYFCVSRYGRSRRTQMLVF